MKIAEHTNNRIRLVTGWETNAIGVVLLAWNTLMISVVPSWVPLFWIASAGGLLGLALALFRSELVIEHDSYTYRRMFFPVRRTLCQGPVEKLKQVILEAQVDTGKRWNTHLNWVVRITGDGRLPDLLESPDLDQSYQLAVSVARLARIPLVDESSEKSTRIAAAELNQPLCQRPPVFSEPDARVGSAPFRSPATAAGPASDPPTNRIRVFEANGVQLSFPRTAKDREVVVLGLFSAYLLFLTGIAHLEQDSFHLPLRFGIFGMLFVGTLLRFLSRERLKVEGHRIESARCLGSRAFRTRAVAASTVTAVDLIPGQFGKTQSVGIKHRDGVLLVGKGLTLDELEWLRSFLLHHISRTGC